MFKHCLWLGALTLSAACATAGANSKATTPPGEARPATGRLPHVSLAAEVSSGFAFMFRYVQETEFVLCLEGEVRPDRIRIDRFRLAHILETRTNLVTYEPCSGPRYIGTAHNHPPLFPRVSMCFQSDADQRSFASDHAASIDVVLCGPEEFMLALKDGNSAVIRF